MGNPLLMERTAAIYGHEGKGKAVPVYGMKECGDEVIVQFILNLGTRCRWVASFMIRPLYLQGKSPRYSLQFGWVSETVWTLCRK
jgi:hypothetical protein